MRVAAQPHSIATPYVDLNTDSGIGTQALFGQRFDVTRVENELAYGELYAVIPGTERVDYVGYLPISTLSNDAFSPTHIVTAIAGAVFERADIKSKLLRSLPRNAAFQGEAQGDFLQLSSGGFIHLRHVRAVAEPLKRVFTDVALDMLHLPYIWGGTGGVGVDCSGLVQSALAACGIDAPRDSGPQECELGTLVSFEQRQLGDLVFWPGHVGMIIADDQLLHANAFHMSVAMEPVIEAVARIGPVRAVKRLRVKEKPA